MNSNSKSKTDKLFSWAWYYFKYLLVLVVLVGIFSVSFMYVFVLSPGELNAGREDSSKVVVKVGDVMDTVKYNDSKEKAYCLYGKTTEHTVVLSHIRKADLSHQTNVSVSYDCFEPTMNQLNYMIRNPSYKIIGTLHTHPEESVRRLSTIDLITASWRVPFYQISGITIENNTKFYSTASANYPMEEVKVTRR